MNRIYCVVGKIMEVCQDIEELLGDICKNSENKNKKVKIFLFFFISSSIFQNE